MFRHGFLVNAVAFSAKRRLAAGRWPTKWRSRTASSDSMSLEKRGSAASTEFGMDNLIEVGRIDNENPTRLKHRSQIIQSDYGPRGYVSSR